MEQRRPSLEDLEEQALQLGPEDRNHLLDTLLASLDEGGQRPEDVEAAWLRLANEREAALAAGLAHEVPLADVIARLTAQLSL